MNNSVRRFTSPTGGTQWTMAYIDTVICDNGKTLRQELKELQDSIPTVPENVSTFTNDAGYLTEIPVATNTTLGAVKVRYVNNKNASGLMISEDGSLYVNTVENRGLKRDGSGMLCALLRRSATASDIDKIGKEDASAEAVVTMSNILDVLSHLHVSYSLPVEEPIE